MSLSINNLMFCYGDHVVLNNINLSVDTGQRIGIIGISGGGKSTLLKLLSGLYTPQSGLIEVAGARSSADIRRRVAMVMQGVALFPASIKENITCGHSMDDQTIYQACEAAQLCQWLETLPEGLETQVGERGGKVSGGQAQRIAIARAIAKDAPVILLDEATSALDGETGTAVLTALAHLTQDKTVVSVSHQPGALLGCDRIYRLEGGSFMMRDLRELFAMAGGLRRFTLLTMLRCPFDALNTLLQASFLQFAFNAITDKNQTGLNWACACFGIGTLLLFLYNGAVWTVYAAYVIRWVGSIRRRLFEKISGLSLMQIEVKSSGDWITRLNADVQAATALLNQPMQLPHAVVSVVNILVSASVLIWMNPMIFGLVMLFVIPHMLISQFFIAKPMTRLAMQVQEATADNAADMHALVDCADIALLYDAQDFLLEHFEKSSLSLRRANMKMRQRSAWGSGLLPLMGMSGYLVIMVLGGALIAGGTLTFGELTAAFQYRGGVMIGLMLFISSMANIKASMAGVKRVNETMHIPEE